MELVNEFTVNRPVDEAWAVLTNLERIAPCLPGAQLEEVEGDDYRGVVKVKVGPISAAFKGQASFLERDDDHHRAVLKGEGRDTGGKGNASARITAQLEPIGDAASTCTVHTDLSITGKVAQFGRGAMADISEKLMAQFAANLNAMLDNEPEDATADEATTEQPGDAVTDADAGASASAATAPRVRTVEGPVAQPIDLLETAGAPLLKRLLPALGGLVLLLLVLRRRQR